MSEWTIKDLEAGTPQSKEKLKRKRELEDSLKENLEDNQKVKKTKCEDYIDRHSKSLTTKSRPFSTSKSKLPDAPRAAESNQFQGGKVRNITSIFEKIKNKEVLEKQGV